MTLRIGTFAVWLVIAGVPQALADDSASLTIRAFVPLSCDIQVETETDDSTSLDLSEGQRDLLVATLWETCNVRAGYKVTISSAGNGKLAGETGAVSYELKYDSTTAKLAGSKETPVAVTDVTNPTPGEGVPRPLTISYRPAKTATGGGYSDTLTFTISPR